VPRSSLDGSQLVTFVPGIHTRVKSYALAMTQWGLDTLFNPAKRHMDEEKRRLQSTREEIGDNSGGNRIDLESGKVVIKRKKLEPAAEAEHEDADHHIEETAQAENAPTSED